MLSPVPLPLWSVSLSDAPMTAGPSPPPRPALLLLVWSSSSSPVRFFLFCLIFPVVLFLCVGSTVAEWQHSCLTARGFGWIPGSPGLSVWSLTCFSPCLDGFPPGTPVSPINQNMNTQLLL
ncbi:hypothetical protein NQD34_018157 [Periophthalmus magnuspinnatus]|nr:hypothetical protein NQD34_018157 [Periophthalmus magnuspinnatus]